MTIDKRPVLIMAGGTGGHVFPALAVAHEILSRNIPVVWLGTQRGIESRLIPEAGIPIEWVSVSGLRGKGLGRLLTAPFMLLLAAWQCLRIMLKIKPRVVLGMGGFVTGPGGVMARLTGKRLCIHEQNAVAGMTNRYLARIANQVLEAFPDSFPDGIEAQETGNPVREDISHLSTPEQRVGARKGVVHLLVLGGSLGAQALNELVPQVLAMMPEGQRPLVKHQTGERNIKEARGYYQQAGLDSDVEVLAFINDMAQAYEWADLVICRAGALTVSELMVAGVASLLVPYPHAVDDHQTKNAEFLVQAEAGLMIQQADLDTKKLFEVMTSLISDRARLLAMANSAYALGKREATRTVADLCLQTGGVGQ